MMRICALAMVALANGCFAQPQPLRRIPQVSEAREISILRVNFQELHYGHEGPGYFPVKRDPFRGEREIAEVSLFGQEAIGTVRFELIGRSGVVLAAAPAFRTGDGADADEFMVRVDVPAEPFRFRIRGRDIAGRPFESVFQRLFVPAPGVVRPLELPAGLTAERARLLQGLVDATAADMQSRFEASGKEGAIRIPRSTVSEATYEPLVSDAGNRIGLRLCLVVRFEQAGYYSLTPQVFPVYQDFRWRGAIEMKVLDTEIAPRPAAAPGLPADGLADMLRYGGAAHYDANVDYRLTFDLAPSYAVRNAAGTRYCMYLEPFRTTGRMAVWNAIQASAEPVKYRVDIGSVEFNAETLPWIPQRTFYEGLLSEGAQDCGATPSIHF